MLNREETLSLVWESTLSIDAQWSGHASGRPEPADAPVETFRSSTSHTSKVCCLANVPGFSRAGRARTAPPVAARVSMWSLPQAGMAFRQKEPPDDAATDGIARSMARAIVETLGPHFDRTRDRQESRLGVRTRRSLGHVRIEASTPRRRWRVARLDDRPHRENASRVHPTARIVVRARRLPGRKRVDVRPALLGECLQQKVRPIDNRNVSIWSSFANERGLAGSDDAVARSS